MGSALAREWVLLRLACQMLTRFPAARGIDYAPALDAAAVRYYPGVGVLVGLAGGAVFAAAHGPFDPLLAAALAIAVTVLLDRGNARGRSRRHRGRDRRRQFGRAGARNHARQPHRRIRHARTHPRRRRQGGRARESIAVDRLRGPGRGAWAQPMERRSRRRDPRAMSVRPAPRARSPARCPLSLTSSPGEPPSRVWRWRGIPARPRRPRDSSSGLSAGTPRSGPPSSRRSRAIRAIAWGRRNK